MENGRATGNTTTIIQQENDSTAQVLATGSQDIAALAGLFCTDGVERNALASEYGYTTVISSALSILGILGLTKSSVKLALGLQKCISSGWSPDSLRGIFGYTLEESERSAGQTIDCLRVCVYHDKEDLIIEKERQRFDADRVPLLAGGWDNEIHDEDSHPVTTINLGNIVRETEFTQSPIIVGLLTVLCSGLTSWLIIIVSLGEEGRWHWTTFLATIGLHVSLIVMLAPALWHAHRTCRPSLYLNGKVWQFFTRTQRDPLNIPKSVTFMRTCKPALNGFHQVLHFRGDVSYLSMYWFKGLMIAAAALCTASYICQYTVLKSADSTAAAIWISIQAGFALLRLLIWLVDPPFDDPRTRHAEYMSIGNLDFHDFSLMRILIDFMGDGQQDFIETPRLDQGLRKLKIPFWAWKYMQQMNLDQILEAAVHENPSLLPRWPSTFRTSGAQDSLAYLSTEAGESADEFLIETNLTRLLDRHGDFLTRIFKGTSNHNRDFPNLRLLLVLFRHPSTGIDLVQPILMLRAEPDQDTRFYQPEMLSLDAQELASPFRFGGPISSSWLPIPARSDIDRLYDEEDASQSVHNWTAFGVELHELVTEKRDITKIEVEYKPAYSHGISKDAVRCLKNLVNADLADLRYAPMAEEHAMLIDMRYIPLPRTWKCWKAAKGGAQEPGEWLAELLRHAESLEGDRTNKYELQFHTSEKCLEYAALYIGYDDEVGGILLLKRATQLAQIINKISEKISALKGLAWLCKGPVKGLTYFAELKIKMTRDCLVDYNFAAPIEVVARPAGIAAMPLSLVTSNKSSQ